MAILQKTFPGVKRLSKIFFLLLFIHCFFLAPGVLSNPVESPGREEFIKTGFLYNFTKFIKWPKDFFPNGRKEFVIGFVGDEGPFKKTLDILADKEKEVSGKKLVIERFSSPNEIRECHILFISSTMEGRLEEILKRVGNLSVLLVGDTPGFAERGVGVNFFIQNKKIRFEFNRKALERAGLEVDSLLLSVGEIVK